MLQYKAAVVNHLFEEWTNSKGRLPDSVCFIQSLLHIFFFFIGIRGASALLFLPNLSPCRMLLSLSESLRFKGVTGFLKINCGNSENVKKKCHWGRSISPDKMNPRNDYTLPRATLTRRHFLLYPDNLIMKPRHLFCILIGRPLFFGCAMTTSSKNSSAEAVFFDLPLLLSMMEGAATDDS